MKPLSVYGSTGFIGSRFCEMTDFPFIKIAREQRRPKSDDVLYFISTTDNYNVFNDMMKDVDTNIKVLLDTLSRFKSRKGVFNFISSWFVYGDTKLPARENAACRPKGFYSITKLAAEDLLVSYCETMGYKYRIIRLCNVYGARDKGVSKKKNALQYLIGELKNDRPVKLYHGGRFYRDYMHVDDICRGIELIVRKGPVNNIINLGSGKKLLFKEIIAKARKQISSKSRISSCKPARFHQRVQVKDFYMDTAKIRRLGFRPCISMTKGIIDLCR